MKRITDPSFKYVPAVETDITKTFKRVRKEQAEQRARETATVVRPITQKRKAS